MVYLYSPCQVQFFAVIQFDGQKENAATQEVVMNTTWALIKKLMASE